MKNKDALGDRMKGYEKTFKHQLLRRSYTMIRIDGKAFHTYTKGLDTPFDQGLIDDMDKTAAFICENIQGAKCAFVQSDEISILVTDFDKLETSAWFDNNIQKMCSVSASLATAVFNRQRVQRYYCDPEWDRATGPNIRDHYEVGCDLDDEMIRANSIVNYMPPINYIAMFDSRVFQLPTKSEVMNYFVWRQQDTVKNSISTVAQTMFSHKELHGKNGNDKQEMMFQKNGTNWNNLNPKLKRGRMIVKEVYEKEPNVMRTRWSSIAPPIFTKDFIFLNNLIPDNN